MTYSRARDDAQSLDLLSAIWILACNDENPAMSYNGLMYRLRLPPSFDIRELVAAHGELFRLKVPKSRVEKMKELYRAGGKLPSWLRAVSDDAARRVAIDALGPDDFFRSQFRASPQAKRSAIEVVDWGLQHIDRLRKRILDRREERSRRWSTIIIPLASTAVALGAITCSAYLQREANREQRELKRFELSFEPKAVGYASLLRAISRSFEHALTGNADTLRRSLDDAELRFIQLEPFLPVSELRPVQDRYGAVIAVLGTLRNAPSVAARDSQTRQFLAERDRLRTHLYDALFPMTARQ